MTLDDCRLQVTYLPLWYITCGTLFNVFLYFVSIHKKNYEEDLKILEDPTDRRWYKVAAKI